MTQEYKALKQTFDEEEAVFQEQHMLHQTWEAFQRATAARVAAKWDGEADVSVKYNDDDEMWPKHTIEDDEARWSRTMTTIGNMTMFPPLPGDF